MNKNIYLGVGFLSIAALFLVGFLIFKAGGLQTPSGTQPEPVATQSAGIENVVPEASPAAVTSELIINFGDNKSNSEKIATYSASLKSPATALSLLQSIAEENNFKVDYNEQNSDIFVKSIKEVVNQRNSLWLFYYNGRLALSPVDKQTLRDGDMVEFRYSSTPQN